VRHALLVLGTAPLALVGALVTLWLAGVPLNASSLMGCVLLVGLVVKNGILLLEQFELLVAAGHSVDEALIEAGARRVRPILMTTIATLAGLLPLVLGFGAGSEIQRPLAVAVIGGLSLSTMISLLVLPALVRLSWARSERGVGPFPPPSPPPSPSPLPGLGLVLVFPFILGGCVPGAGGRVGTGTGSGGLGVAGHPAVGSASGGATGAVSGSGGQTADATIDVAADVQIAVDAAAEAGPSLPEAGVDPDSGSAALPGWSLVWSDEFSVDGPPDPASWQFESGFVRNMELQWYQAPNAAVTGGVLTIEGRRERVPNPRYQAGSADWRTSRAFADYTSASITTAGKRTFTYGRFEARARIDVRQGSWPAFWTLGTTGGWPGGGEVDIMEFYASKVLANVCRPAGGTCAWSSGIQTLAELGPDWPSQFHVWAMEWDATRIELFLDGKSTNHFDVAGAVGAGAVNPYVARPVYLLLNLALGANGGDPTGTTFPLKYEIDYVRVYQRPP
jgi:beta-glucanase (GH16 family)